MKRLIYILCLLFPGVLAYGQMNASLQKIATEVSSDFLIYFKEDVQINPETLFEDNRNAFELSSDDVMKIGQVFTDDIGYTHYNYRQFYKGIPIDGESVNVSFPPAGTGVTALGNILKGIDLQIKPKLSETEAIQAVLDFISAEEYMWQNTFFENELKEKKEDTTASYYPIPELVIKEERNQNSGTGVFHLAYRMDIYTSSPFYAQRVFIDAVTGLVIENYPLMPN